MLMKRVELTSSCGFLNGEMYWFYKVSATSAGSVISVSLVFFFKKKNLDVVYLSRCRKS